MATVGPLHRQPEKLDYASPTQFVFVINQLPKVQFFTVAANIPGITLGETVFPTPFRQTPIQGDDITFDNFEISFIVDEYLENYLSLHTWITGTGFPRTRQQFKDFRDSTSETSGILTGSGNIPDSTVESDRSMVSDTTLTILSNKNNPIIEVRFRDMFPVSIGGLSYDQGATDVDYIRTDATFAYQQYTIHAL